jgi:hypothetical protein
MRRKATLKKYLFCGGPRHGDLLPIGVASLAAAGTTADPLLDRDGPLSRPYPGYRVCRWPLAGGGVYLVASYGGGLLTPARLIDAAALALDNLVRVLDSPKQRLPLNEMLPDERGAPGRIPGLSMSGDQRLKEAHFE